MTRFFLLSAGLHESIRAGLDAAWGHPRTEVSADGVEVVTVTCMSPASELPTHADGGVYAAVLALDCDRPEVAGMLAGLIASGEIIEITETEWRAAQASSTPF